MNFEQSTHQIAKYKKYIILFGLIVFVIYYARWTRNAIAISKGIVNVDIQINQKPNQDVNFDKQNSIDEETMYLNFISKLDWTKLNSLGLVQTSNQEVYPFKILLVRFKIS